MLTEAGRSRGIRDRVVMSLSLLDAVWKNGSQPQDAYVTGEPLDGLMLTLLSQNTNDRNRDKAYDALRAAMPEWKDVAAAPVEEVAAKIRPAGIFETKAARMKEILAIIRKDFGEYSLAELRGWEPERAREFLGSLPGIGPKTVACVMVFDLEIPAFPVDTHVARISRRLGWVPERMPAAQIQDFLEKTVPADQKRGGHLNMIEHGRNVCAAQKPKCGACVLLGLCDYGRSRVELRAGG